MAVGDLELNSGIPDLYLGLKPMALIKKGHPEVPTKLQRRLDRRKNLQTHKQAIQDVIKRLLYPESACL